MGFKNICIFIIIKIFTDFYFCKQVGDKMNQSENMRSENERVIDKLIEDDSSVTSENPAKFVIDTATNEEKAASQAS